MGHAGKPWVADFEHPHYQAGIRAVKKVFGVEPDMTREGGSIPVTLAFQELTGSKFLLCCVSSRRTFAENVMLLPIGACDDMAHSQNEKLNISNYMQGVRFIAIYSTPTVTTFRQNCWPPTSTRSPQSRSNCCRYIM